MPIIIINSIFVYFSSRIRWSQTPYFMLLPPKTKTQNMCQIDFIKIRSHHRWITLHFIRTFDSVVFCSVVFCLRSLLFFRSVSLVAFIDLTFRWDRNCVLSLRFVLFFFFRPVTAIAIQYSILEKNIKFLLRRQSCILKMKSNTL